MPYVTVTPAFRDIISEKWEMGSIKVGKRPLVENPQMQKANITACTDVHTNHMRHTLPTLPTWGVLTAAVPPEDLLKLQSQAQPLHPTPEQLDQNLLLFQEPRITLYTFKFKKVVLTWMQGSNKLIKTQVPRFLSWLHCRLGYGVLCLTRVHSDAFDCVDTANIELYE